MERKARGRAGCADSSDTGGQQSWDQNSVWPDWNSPGEHCLRCRWVTPPFAALSKATVSTCKKRTLFQFLVNIDNKYPYHFCKWGRCFIIYRVKVLSKSTPPMLLHMEWHSGYLTLQRRYFGSKWDWVNWLGARRKAVTGKSKTLHSTSCTQILSPTYLAV